MGKVNWGDIAYITMQYNLQERDAPLMDAEKIARETKATGCDTVCINVAAACTWYPTRVPYLRMVDEVAAGRDILGEVIAACHAQGIKVLGRFGWGMIDEEVYRQKPQWVTRAADGAANLNDPQRPGGWGLLYQACCNGGYHREAVMLPALREVVQNYPLDGIFWCAGFAQPCWCDNCKSRYQGRYGKPLPQDAAQFEPDWLTFCGEDLSQLFYDELQQVKPGMPFIRYYWPFDVNMGNQVVAADNIVQKAQSGNALCTEAQDILSLGTNDLPVWNTPAMRVKMGRIVEDYPAPICIVHTCPGMDWRHVGMPAAEYLYWSAQVAANGGRFWVSLTGFYDTVPDKRILAAIDRLCGMIGTVKDDMDNAESAAQVLLFVNGGESAQGWAHALMCSHIDFDVATGYSFSAEKLAGYPLVVVPGDIGLDDGQAQALGRYVEAGGSLIVEGHTQAALAPYAGLLGVEGDVHTSEELVATYIRIEEAGQALRSRLGQTELLPLRGRVGFCSPAAGTQTLASWVPPFASFGSAGNPPERASLPTKQTDIPLCLVNQAGKGRTMLLPYQAGMLVERYGMRDFIDAIGAYAGHMLKQPLVTVEAPADVMLTQFHKNGALLLHFVNGIGQRPLKDNVECHGIRVAVRLPKGKKATAVRGVIAGVDIPFETEADTLHFELPPLKVWGMVKITTG